MKYIFDKYTSYTSNKNLSSDKVKEIENSNYNNFPNYIIIGNKRIDILKELENISDIECSKAGYKEIHPGIRVRIEILSIDPDYKKENGRVNCRKEMTILSKKN